MQGCVGVFWRPQAGAQLAQLEVKNLKWAFLAAFSDVIESGVEVNNLVVHLKSMGW